MRVLVRHGFSRDLADLLVDDLKRCMAYFEKNPVSHKAVEEESGGYMHS
jgi:glutamate decarboxylase